MRIIQCLHFQFKHVVENGKVRMIIQLVSELFGHRSFSQVIPLELSRGLSEKSSPNLKFNFQKHFFLTEYSYGSCRYCECEWDMCVILRVKWQIVSWSYNQIFIAFYDLKNKIESKFVLLASYQFLSFAFSSLPSFHSFAQQRTSSINLKFEIELKKQN